MTSELSAVGTALPAPAPTTEPDPSLLVGRGYWPRAGAYLIDAFAIIMLANALGLVVGMAVGFVYGALGHAFALNPATLETLGGLLSLGSLLAYFVLCEGLGGATIGKLLMGLRVVRRDGSPCDVGAALLRGIIRPFDSILFGLPALLSMREPLNQRLGDRAADTLVVDANTPHLIAPRPRSRVWMVLALWALCHCFILTTVLLLAITA